MTVWEETIGVVQSIRGSKRRKRGIGMRPTLQVQMCPLHNGAAASLLLRSIGIVTLVDLCSLSAQVS